MHTRQNLKICFMGGRQAGIIGLLSLLARGDSILSAVSYSSDLTDILTVLGIPAYNSIYDAGFVKTLRASDLLLSVHARELIKKDLLQLPKLGAINIHPYLYKYKGAHPVERALKDRNYNASVGAHIIEEKVDCGAVIVEYFVDVAGATSVDEIYNRLYPCYSKVILKALDIVKNENK